MASTTTSPAGSVIRGENRPKKNMPMIMAAHGIPYVATASISYPEDFMNKVKKACEIDGPAFIQILQPCTTGWGYPASKTVELGRLAVKAGIWPLYEIENGEYRVTYKPSKRISIEEYLKTQKRYRHLTEEDVEEMQQLIDHKCQEMGI
jgi:pyruvate ferredoxin oxidoreductase beta subunit